MLIICKLFPFREGVQKYYWEAWREGSHTSVLVDAALRHIENCFCEGQGTDPDSPTGKHYLAGVVFCCLSILNTLEIRPELDDRPHKTKEA